MLFFAIAKCPTDIIPIVSAQSYKELQRMKHWLLEFDKTML